ncbi:MAG: gamma-glutamyl-gamma-aminobutyrate hydrolase family protein [Candidatus Pacebacteria bacterium]|nr:gamma-glutamyl-gamma-aminobutyrate hydrolase family protein [Candidatus Paceibacterota bacterium]
MAAHKKRPMIGVTLDAEAAGGYSKMPWYALRQNYCGAIVAAGGLPIALPHEPELVADYLDQIDGLVITGGAFDVDPKLFGAESRHVTVTTKDQRTAFELGITQGALKRGIPILGICGGEQLLAVALGGRLIQHIPDSVANCLEHEQPNPRTEAGHTVNLLADSMLAKLARQQGMGLDNVPVNSAHHQAVESLGSGMIASAKSSDGVIEAIEDPSRRFCLGVQWHPEYHISKLDKAIYQEFIQACQ